MTFFHKFNFLILCSKTKDFINSVIFQQKSTAVAHDEIIQNVSIGGHSLKLKENAPGSSSCWHYYGISVFKATCIHCLQVMIGLDAS